MTLERIKPPGGAWETTVENGGSLPAHGGTSPLGYTSAFALQVDGGQLDGGSYTLGFRGQTTAAISWDEDPSAKLEALSNIGAGNVGTVGPNELPDRTLVFFSGDLLTAEVVVGVDVTIASQALTYLGDPVTLTIAQWETGQEPAEGAAVVDLRVETSSVLGIPVLWANVGTTESPNWVAVNGVYAYQSAGELVAGAIVSLDGSGVQISAESNGQERTSIRVNANGSIEINVTDASGAEINGVFLDDAFISMPYLPGSDPGGSGRLWNDGGTVKVT